jgi:hypothetical protein
MVDVVSSFGFAVLGEWLQRRSSAANVAGMRHKCRKQGT